MSTIDWNEHWEEKEEPESAREFAMKMADRICDFIRDKNIQTVADYGCGAGTLLFTLAERFPEREFFGFDTASSIIRKNKEKAVYLQMQNIHFDQDGLPYPRIRRTSDLVTCFSTLHYVKEIEHAIQYLFELVNSGGHLIFNYPNIYTKRAYQNDIKPDDEYMKQRFSLVLEGENLLSLRKIKEILGITPRKFYSSIKSNIYVSIQKNKG